MKFGKAREPSEEITERRTPPTRCAGCRSRVHEVSDLMGIKPVTRRAEDRLDLFRERRAR